MLLPNLSQYRYNNKMKKTQPTMKKRNLKEIFLYILFGVLTTIVSISLFYLFHRIWKWNEHISNILSWICAVLFAFFTNRIWVFEQSTQGFLSFIRQMTSFFVGRLFTLGLEEGIILIFITMLHYNSMLVKTAAQIIVIAANYFISKLVVFREKE